SLIKRKSFCFVRSPRSLPAITPPLFLRAVWYQKHEEALQIPGESVPPPHARISLVKGTVHFPNPGDASGYSRPPCQSRKILRSVLSRLNPYCGKQISSRYYFSGSL